MLVLVDLNLPIISADFAVIALGVELRIHDVLIDELHNREHRRNVILQVRHLHIADCAARGELLELRLELQLAERVDLLPDIHMVAVGDVVVIRDILDDAKPLLQTLCKLVCCGFHRRTVERVADILRFSPLHAVVIQRLHDLQRKWFCLLVGVALSGHLHAHLVQAGVAEADGRVVAEQQLVDLLTLLESCERTILPENRRYI